MDIEALRTAARDFVQGIVPHGDALPLLPDHLVRSDPSKEEVLRLLESFEYDQCNIDQVRVARRLDSNFGY